MKTIPPSFHFHDVATRNPNTSHVVPIRLPADRVCLEITTDVSTSCRLHENRVHSTRGPGISPRWSRLDRGDGLKFCFLVFLLKNNFVEKDFKVARGLELFSAGSRPECQPPSQHRGPRDTCECVRVHTCSTAEQSTHGECWAPGVWSHQKWRERGLGVTRTRHPGFQPQVQLGCGHPWG